MTGSYEVSVRRSAEKSMRFIPRRDLGRVVSRIAPLASNPRPTGCEKLSGQERYRLRQGACRIVYAIDDTAKTVDVVAVARRRDVYR